MREVTRDLWDYLTVDGLWPSALCVTTNGYVRRDGALVMGRGVALQSKRYFPGIEQELGRAVTEYGGNHVHAYQPRGWPLVYAVAFPVKHRWDEPADLDLIRRSSKELRFLADALGWRSVVLPRPGCGNGGRTWDEVWPLLGALDDRFTVVSV